MSESVSEAAPRPRYLQWQKVAEYVIVVAIVLESAFFAAQEGTSIGMSHLVRATRREHQKIGKLIHEADFGPYYHLVRVEDPGL